MNEFTYSGVAWKVDEFYKDSWDAMEGKISHICTDKFEFSGKSNVYLDGLRRDGYSVIVRKRDSA